LPDMHVRMGTTIATCQAMLGSERSVNYGSIEYTVRLGVGRNQWICIVYYPGRVPSTMRFSGTREAAIEATRLRIRNWLERHEVPRPSRTCYPSRAAGFDPATPSLAVSPRVSRQYAPKASAIRGWWYPLRARARRRMVQSHEVSACSLPTRSMDQCGRLETSSR
jgi:hypothetical protein